MQGSAEVGDRSGWGTSRRRPLAPGRHVRHVHDGQVGSRRRSRRPATRAPLPPSPARTMAISAGTVSTAVCGADRHPVLGQEADHLRAVAAGRPVEAPVTTSGRPDSAPGPRRPADPARDRRVRRSAALPPEHLLTQPRRQGMLHGRRHRDGDPVQICTADPGGQSALAQVTGRRGAGSAGRRTPAGRTRRRCRSSSTPKRIRPDIEPTTLIAERAEPTSAMICRACWANISPAAVTLAGR